MPDYYPIMLDVRGRRAVVVGGDAVAAEKARALAECGARVTAIGPEFGPALRTLGESGAVVLAREPYRPGDLAGATVVVIATDDERVVDAACAEARERGQLLNVVDVPSRCTFIVPSILRRERLTIAVSTEGASPGLAKRIRQRLEDLFPPAYGPYLRLAAAARARLRAAGVSYGQRDDFFGEYAASDALERLERDDTQGAARTTAALLQRYGVDAADICAAWD
jgi:precorrin-2 dehydrogenase/sirohydrochlorin ferrochelatase